MSLSPTLSTRDLFLNACREGDLELARVLLARGAGVDWRREDLFLWSGLHYAARADHVDLVNLLLSQPGIDVNIKGGGNCTPLMLACQNGSENVIGKLLQVEDINLNCQSNRGRTALHYAAWFDFPGCVQLLREAPGLEWNLKNEDGETPLLMAADCRSAASLEVILGVAQVDITATDNEGYNVAWCALPDLDDEVEVEDRQRCVELLTADPRVDWNTKDPEDGNTPLLYCLERAEMAEMAEIIIRNPTVDLNAQNDAGKFPETIAREENLVDIQKELWTFTNVQRRMILNDSVATREAGNISSLQRLSREAVQLSLVTNNSQERLVRPLVDRLGETLGWNGWEKGEELLRAMASYPGSAQQGENGGEQEEGEESDVGEEEEDGGE